MRENQTLQAENRKSHTLYIEPQNQLAERQGLELALQEEKKENQALRLHRDGVLGKSLTQIENILDLPVPSSWEKVIDTIKDLKLKENDLETVLDLLFDGDPPENPHPDDIIERIDELKGSDTSSLTDPFDEGYRLGLRHGADEADKADKAWKLRIEICENTGLRPGASNAELIEGLWELNKKLQRPLNTKPQQRQKGDDPSNGTRSRTRDP